MTLLRGGRDGELGVLCEGIPRRESVRLGRCCHVSVPLFNPPSAASSAGLSPRPTWRDTRRPSPGGWQWRESNPIIVSVRSNGNSSFGVSGRFPSRLLEVLPLISALGVSGGPDSMALCVLAAGWKSCGLGGKSESSGFIDGLLGIVVDHRLRPESTEEAKLVCTRVMKLGTRHPIGFVFSTNVLPSIRG